MLGAGVCLWLITRGSDARAIYQVQSDSGIACVDLATGRDLWRRPDTYRRPRLWVEGGRLVVEEEDPPRGRITVVPRRDGTLPDVTPRREAFDLQTGAPLPLRAGALEVAQLTPLESALRSASGITLAWDDDHLNQIATTDGDLLLDLEWSPSELVVAGEVVVLRFDGAWSATLYGWDLSRRALAWELDLGRHVPDLPREPYVSLEVDDGRLLVVVDQWLLAFSVHGEPRLAWKTELPRQQIRTADAPWTTLARHGPILFAQVYERLFALRASDGELLWSHDGGAHVTPWPLVHDDRACMQFRAVTREPIRAPRTPSAEAFRALEIRQSASGWSMTPVSKIPRRAQVWSFLDPPPPPRRAATSVVLSLHHDERADASSVSMIELTGALARDRAIYVEFHGPFEQAELHHGDALVAHAGWQQPPPAGWGELVVQGFGAAGGDDRRGLRSAAGAMAVGAVVLASATRAWGERRVAGGGGLYGTKTGAGPRVAASGARAGLRSVDRERDLRALARAALADLQERDAAVHADHVERGGRLVGADLLHQAAGGAAVAVEPVHGDARVGGRGDRDGELERLARRGVDLGVARGVALGGRRDRVAAVIERGLGHRAGERGAATGGRGRRVGGCRRGRGHAAGREWDEEPGEACRQNVGERHDRVEPGRRET